MDGSEAAALASRPRPPRPRSVQLSSSTNRRILAVVHGSIPRDSKIGDDALDDHLVKDGQATPKTSKNNNTIKVIASALLTPPATPPLSSNELQRKSSEASIDALLVQDVEHASPSDMPLSKNGLPLHHQRRSRASSKVGRENHENNGDHNSSPKQSTRSRQELETLLEEARRTIQERERG